MKEEQAMDAFCTYCSRNKNHQKNPLPAIQRYECKRIENIFNASKLINIGFFILSGEYGILEPDELIEHYDHLLKMDEAMVLSNKVSDQLINKHITRLIYFSEPLSTKTLIPYYICISSACMKSSIPFFTVEINQEIKERKMSDWAQITQYAVDANKMMVANRESGEERFATLIKNHPNDGMIYYQRGLAYEILGEFDLAKSDFEKAEKLFPKQEYKGKAQDGLGRVTK